MVFNEEEKLRIVGGNMLIDEFLGVQTKIHYESDISSLFKVLDKIQTFKDEKGITAYNYDITSNQRQPEYGHNMFLYSSGDGHGVYLQFNIKNAYSREIGIWCLVVAFIKEFNKQGGKLPTYSNL